MSDKTLTPVGWLVNELVDKKFIAENGAFTTALITAAKEMERQMIIDAYKADRYPCSDEDAEQYYTENYKP